MNKNNKIITSCLIGLIGIGGAVMLGQSMTENPTNEPSHEQKSSEKQGNQGNSTNTIDQEQKSDATSTSRESIKSDVLVGTTNPQVVRGSNIIGEFNQNGLEIYSSPQR